MRLLDTVGQNRGNSPSSSVVVISQLYFSILHLSVSLSDSRKEHECLPHFTNENNMKSYIEIICLICLIKICEIASITTRAHHPNSPLQTKQNYRRHVGPAPPTDWELGLREAAHQALLREHHSPDPEIRDRLMDAPFIGRHDGATPFGDIAVLARGQLYGTHNGFKFVQDQDCEDEDKKIDQHDNRCNHQQWQSDYNNLLALWTVKRIRHRDPKYGYVFEIEYTISPITPAINEEILMRHGFFNYNVPGHIFVIKSDPRLNSAYYLNNNKFDDKWEKNPHHEHHHHQQQQYVDDIDKDNPNDENGNGQFKPGILIGIGPNGYKHVLHSLPGFYTSYHPSVSYPDQTTIDPKEYELYKKLIESLASKTTQPQNGYGAQVPHRFSITSSTTTTPKMPMTTKPIYHQISSNNNNNGYVKFPNVVPPAYVPNNSIQSQIKPIRFPAQTTSTTTSFSPPELVYHTTPTKVTTPMLFHDDIFADPNKPPPTTPLTTSSKPTKKYTEKPSTTTMKQHQFVPVVHYTENYHTELNKNTLTPEYGTKLPVTTTTTSHFIESTDSLTTPTRTYITTPSKFTEATSSLTYKPTKVSRKPSTITTSKLPKPADTTIYYYTPKEDFEYETTKFTKKPTTTFTTTQKQKMKTTTKKKYTTTQAPPLEVEDNFDLFPAIAPTEAMKPALTHPLETTSISTTQAENAYPSSVNDQLPPPEKNTEITVPYVTSAVTQPSTDHLSKTESYGTQFIDRQTTVMLHNNEDANTEKTDYYTTIRNEEKVDETYNYPTTINDDHKTTIYDKKKETTYNPFTATETMIPFTSSQASRKPSKSTTSNTIHTTLSTKRPLSYEELEEKMQTTHREVIKTTFPPTTVYYNTNNEKDNTILTTLDTTFTTDLIDRETTHKTSPIFTSTTPHQHVTTSNKIETTQKITRKPTKKPTTSSNDDFFAEPQDTSGGSDYKPSSQSKDVDEDDIFGQTKSTAKPQTMSTPKKQVIQSDLAAALFGDERRPKQIKVSTVSSSTITTTSAPKIIYSNFYVPSTQPMHTTKPYYKTTPRIVSEPTLEYQDATNFEGVTKLLPVTDTSVSTSISFQVNKRNATSPFSNLEPTIMADVTEIVDPKGKFKIFKAELPSSTTPNYDSTTKTTTHRSAKVETKKVFDHLALQLVNHAKSIDYLNSSNNNRKTTSRQPKYKRRRYDPKRRASQRTKLS